jgi:hypothetical protein
MGIGWHVLSGHACVRVCTRVCAYMRVCVVNYQDRARQWAFAGDHACMRVRTPRGCGYMRECVLSLSLVHVSWHVQATARGCVCAHAAARACVSACYWLRATTRACVCACMASHTCVSAYRSSFGRMCVDWHVQAIRWCGCVHTRLRMHAQVRFVVDHRHVPC